MTPLQNLLDEISNCAEKAPADRWEFSCSQDGRRGSITCTKQKLNPLIQYDPDDGGFGFARAAALRHFARMDPPTTLALVQMLRKAMETMQNRCYCGQTTRDLKCWVCKTLTEINAIAAGLK